VVESGIVRPDQAGSISVTEQRREIGGGGGRLPRKLKWRIENTLGECVRGRKGTRNAAPAFWRKGGGENRPEDRRERIRHRAERESCWVDSVRQNRAASEPGGKMNGYGYAVAPGDYVG